MKRAVFLDRDGTLNRNVWNPATSAFESPLAPEQLELLPGVIPALQDLRDAGYLLILVSNQPNFAKGKSTMQTLRAIHQELERLLRVHGILLDACCYCFHHPDFTGACLCRKPSPYFLLEAGDRFGIDLAESWMIGDRTTDIECGRAAGVKTIFLTDAGGATSKPDHCATDLQSAAQIILHAQTASASAGLRVSMR